MTKDEALNQLYGANCDLCKYRDNCPQFKEGVSIRLAPFECHEDDHAKQICAKYTPPLHNRNGVEIKPGLAWSIISPTDYFLWIRKAKRNVDLDFHCHLHGDKSVTYRVPFDLYFWGEMYDGNRLLATEKRYRGKRDRVAGIHRLIRESIDGVEI